MRWVAVAILVPVLGALTGSAQTNDSAQAPPATPIIAHLFADPAAFAGRPVMVYGLVVESEASGAIFMLQDVSLRPLKVIGSDLLRASEGDQVTVIGILQTDQDEPYLRATALIPTRVLAGGGCC